MKMRLRIAARMKPGRLVGQGGGVRASTPAKTRIDIDDSTIHRFIGLSQGGNNLCVTWNVPVRSCTY